MLMEKKDEIFFHVQLGKIEEKLEQLISIRDTSLRALEVANETDVKVARNEIRIKALEEKQSKYDANIKWLVLSVAAIIIAAIMETILK